MLSNSKSISSQLPIQTNTISKVIAGLILLFIIPLEGMLHPAFSRAGADFVLEMQEGLGTVAGYHFFAGVSYIGSEWVLLMLPPVLYHFFNPEVAVKVTLVLCMSLYFDSILNMIYCEPRPFWVLSAITGEVCPEGYANPSSEITMFTIGYFYTVILLTYGFGIYTKFSFYSVGVVLSLLLSFGSVYLGVLFVHQALTTLCFDFVYLTVCLTIDSLLTKITKQAAFGYATNRVHTVYWFVITVAFMLGAIAVYDLITIQQTIDISWVENATEDCNIRFDVGSNYSFFVGASIFYNYGVMLGSMHLCKVMPEDWWKTPWWKSAIRTLVACGLIIGLFFLFHLIPVRDTTTQYCFHFIIFYFIAGYAMAMLVPRGSKHVQLTAITIQSQESPTSSSAFIINKAETELNSVSP